MALYHPKEKTAKALATFLEFWMTWSPTESKGEKTRYGSMHDAEYAARRLAVEFPGEVFYVMRATRRASALQIEWAEAVSF